MIGFKLQIRALNGAGNELIRPKTLFPFEWDGFKIAEQFFEIFRNIDKVKKVTQGCWITTCINGQNFTAFINNSQIIKTFYPEVPN